MSFNIKTVKMFPEDTSLEGSIKNVIENNFTGKKDISGRDLNSKSKLIFHTIAQEIHEELAKKKLGGYYYNVLVCPVTCNLLSDGFGLYWTYTEKYEFYVNYNNGFNCLVRIWR